MCIEVLCDLIGGLFLYATDCFRFQEREVLGVDSNVFFAMSLDMGRRKEG